MRRLKRSVLVKPSDALLTTRWLDVASATLWFIYAVWGLSAFANQLSSFRFIGAPTWYGTVWALLIGLCSLIASLAAASIFFELPRIKQVSKKIIERDALGVFVTLIFIYHVVVIWASTAGHHVVFGTMFLIFSYYVMPAFRMYHLNRRIQVLSARE